jgi:hypothetical protein
MNIEDYLVNLPGLHSWDGGLTWNSGGFDRFHLDTFIRLTAEIPDCHVIETGAGNSTIAFLLGSPTKLVSICPELELFQKIVKFCGENTINISNLDQVVAFSEIELPKILAELKSPEFDIALIDGSHGWPYTFIDLYGMSAVLKRGGYLILDDLQLHSVKEMAKFISADEKNWKTHIELGKAVVFQKLTDQVGFGDWTSQPYITAMSEKISHWKDPYAYKSYDN